MWRKRFIKFWLSVVAIIAAIASTTILAYAAVASDFDPQEVIEEITDTINPLEEDVEIVFSYNSADFETENISEVEDESEIQVLPEIETETEPMILLKVETEAESESIPVTIPEEDIISLILEEKKEITLEQIVQEDTPAVRRSEYASHLSNAASAVTKTVEEGDQYEITLNEELEDGTRVYNFKNGTYTIPANHLERMPVVAENGYVEKITEVPHYLQQSYPYTNYGWHGTVSSHGCGITSCAMVYSYLLDYAIKPDELAEKYGGYNTEVGSSYTLFPDSAEDFGLEMQVSYSWTEVEDALKRGCVVIANVQSDTIFTQGGHFIVYYGITEDGKILINDPNIYNYGQWSGNALKEGFKNGFDQKYCKYSFPCWIYEPKDVDAISNQN